MWVKVLHVYMNSDEQFINLKHLLINAHYDSICYDDSDYSISDANEDLDITIGDIDWNDDVGTRYTSIKFRCEKNNIYSHKILSDREISYHYNMFHGDFLDRFYELFNMFFPRSHNPTLMEDLTLLLDGTTLPDAMSVKINDDGIESYEPYDSDHPRRVKTGQTLLDEAKREHEEHMQRLKARREHEEYTQRLRAKKLSSVENIKIVRERILDFLRI